MMDFLFFILALFMAFNASLAAKSSVFPLSSQFNLATSTISAAPAFLPNPSSSSSSSSSTSASAYAPSPSSSPDENPLFPTPKGGSSVPTGEPSMPTIPSNPSPPNPDEILSPEPNLAVSPSGSLSAMSSSTSLTSVNFAGSLGMLMIIMFWLLQLFEK